MTDKTAPSTARPSAGPRRVAWLHATAFLVASLLALPVAAADGGAPDAAPPPEFSPVSRLTVTPEEFAAWLAGTPGGIPLPPVHLDVPLPPVLAAPPPPKLSAPPPVTKPAAPKQAGQPPAAPNLAPPPAVPPSGGDAVTLPPGSRDTVRPPAMAPRPDAVRIVYGVGDSEVPDRARPELDALVFWLAANPGVRIKVLGFAGTATQSASQARWLSQARATAVRDYLVGKGIAIDRISVLPRGDKTDEDPKDRVDIVIPPG